jgi:fatty-acyl-CoA synthase
MRTDAFLSRRSVNHVPLTPVSFLWRTVEVHANKIAVVEDDRRLTWAQFGGWVKRIGGALHASGVQSGDVVSTVASNCAELLAAHFAVPLAGAVLNAINTRLDIDSLAYIFEHAESKLLLAHAAHAELVNLARRRIGRRLPTVWFGRDVRSALQAGDQTLDKWIDDAPLPEEDLIADEWSPICLNYTSGTTARPKGVVCHHRGAYLNALGNVLALKFSPETRYLWVLPMFHCNGWTHTWAVTAAGGMHICAGSLDPSSIIRVLEQGGVTHMCCAPTVLTMLASDPAFDGLKLRNAVTVGTGGAPPSATLLEKLRAAGLNVTHLYGLTETFGPTSFCAPTSDWSGLSSECVAERLARQGAAHALASNLKVLDAEHRELPWDGVSTGEIVLEGNTVMAGYYKDPVATEKAFAGGVFHTGDLAVRHPDGQIEIRDRAKDIIVSGGENIASIEIESALLRHDTVMLAAVVAMPDDKWGEVPCAFIELRPGSSRPSETELADHCRKYLARYKVPKRFVFREIPKTATGKLQKHVLRELIARTGGKSST